MVIDISVLMFVVLINSTPEVASVASIVPRVGMGGIVPRVGTVEGTVVGISISLRSSLGLSGTLLASPEVASVTDIGTIVPRVAIGAIVVGKVVGIGISLRSSLGLRCSYSLGLTPLASHKVSSIEPAVVSRSSVVEATIVGVSVSSGLGSGLRLGNSRGKQGEKNLNKDIIKS